MATGAAQMMLQNVFGGSIPMHDLEIERRPYHKNCSCALHKLKGGCSNAFPLQRNLSFPNKKEWTDSSMSITASKFSSD
ncbi:Zinc finger, SWIM-type [Quillaja saponaria]|uniref:Zinc finger, SWIM-type n=1 Tax=Quillaja saponaria TaxID=32244 RepID=A0AAD7LGD3_QUISA|nr:Zinc finger, SWIM-type [Quillaja saponaria]